VIILTNVQGAWDQYIQGSGTNTMDPSLQMWPMNMDFNQLDPNLQQSDGQQQPPQQAAPGASSGNPADTFMGAATPRMM
jgi:hypothetical protein